MIRFKALALHKNTRRVARNQRFVARSTHEILPLLAGKSSTPPTTYNDAILSRSRPCHKHHLMNMFCVRGKELAAAFGNSRCILRRCQRVIIVCPLNPVYRLLHSSPVTKINQKPKLIAKLNL